MPRVLTTDPPPAAVAELLDQRRRAGADRRDEMWDGVLHMAPAPTEAHAIVAAQLAELLGPPARAAGLTPSLEFNLGTEHDYRIPDLGLHRERGWGTWAATAVLAIEVVSPGDETYDKFAFYAAHDVDEILVVEPDQRSVRWFALAASGQAARTYTATTASGVIDLTAEQLSRRLDWP